MSHVEWVLDSPSSRSESRRFFDIFAEEVQNAAALQIAVGYLSEESIKYLSEIATTFPSLSIDLTVGMHAREGITKRQLDAATALHHALSSQKRGGVYVTPRMAYHGKIYIFDKGQNAISYIGSANLSSIVPHYSGSFEAGLILTSESQVLKRHLEKDVYPHRLPIVNADIPIVERSESPMIHVDEAEPVAMPQVIDVFTSPVTYRFNIPLKANAASSLNAHMSGGGIRKNKLGGLQRDWYEGELIVSKKITQLPGYPENGVPFKVVTDDGWSFECVVNGQAKKNLRSAGKLSTFGTWMKSRLMEAGVIEFGELATDETISSYGRDSITMSFHPDHDVWTLDLSVDNTKGEN